MRLSDCEVGRSCRVIGIELSDKSKRRLEILGMTKNTVVSVLNKKRSGTVIIKVRGARFALGKEIAGGVNVRGEDE